jgi:hypothetical protein
MRTRLKATEYLFFCPSMQHIHFLNSIKTCFGLTRPPSVVIEYSPPEVVALLCQFSPCASMNQYF